MQDELLAKRSDNLSIDEFLRLAEKLAYVKGAFTEMGQVCMAALYLLLFFFFCQSARRVRDIISMVIYAALSIASVRSLLTSLPSVISVWSIASICELIVQWLRPACLLFIKPKKKKTD